jgi:hypothetical protein
MEQQAIIHLFALKEEKPNDIHAELKSVNDSETPALRTVKKCRRGFQQGKTNLFDDLRSAGPSPNNIGEAIGSILAENPFSLCKVRCRHFRIGRMIF